MIVKFVRFEASDGVILQGWLSDGKSQKAALHIHGMSGNGYENYFLDNIREAYTDLGISFFTIDTRGRGIISEFRGPDGNTKLGGSCFEIFEESVYDIQGAIDYLKSLGKTEIILQGHSLGGSKVVNYLVGEPDPAVKQAILLAPTDMIKWSSADSENDEYTSRAKVLVADGKGQELVAAQCWLDKTPISAATYLSLCSPNSPTDIYGDRPEGSILSQLKIPTTIIYGDKDIGIIKGDGNIQNYQNRLNSVKNADTELVIVEDADHGFNGKQPELASIIAELVS